MNKKQFNVLLVDDHPLITSAYEHAFAQIEKQEPVCFQIRIANNFPSALHVLGQRKFDLVFLDIQLPPYESEGLLSGEDLGARIRGNSKATKIVVSTTFNDHYRIQSIIEQVSPDGFLIKNDITPQELELAIWRIITDPPYYSKTVVQSMRQYISNDFILDRIDRQLLYHLSKGASLNEIAKELLLSRAAIAKRKQHLKEVFNVVSGEDRLLLEQARDKGFI